MNVEPRRSSQLVVLVDSQFKGPPILFWANEYEIEKREDGQQYFDEWKVIGKKLVTVTEGEGMP